MVEFYRPGLIYTWMCVHAHMHTQTLIVFSYFKLSEFNSSVKAFTLASFDTISAAALHNIATPWLLWYYYYPGVYLLVTTACVLLRLLLWLQVLLKRITYISSAMTLSLLQHQGHSVPMFWSCSHYSSKIHNVQLIQLSL